MSADNWAVCPRCWARAKAKADDEAETVRSLYGTVPVEEFDELRAGLVRPDPEDYATFREDYEFYGADEGEVTAEYKGHCNVCDLGAELHHSVRFWEPGQ